MSGYQYHAEHRPATFTEEQLQAQKARLERQAMWRKKVMERTGQPPSSPVEREHKYLSRDGTCDSLAEPCARPILAKRLCAMHYRRMWREG